MLRALKKSQEIVNLTNGGSNIEGIDPERIALFNKSPYFLRLFAAYTAETEGNRRIDVRFMRGLIRVLALANFIIADEYGKEYNRQVELLERKMKRARTLIGEDKR